MSADLRHATCSGHLRDRVILTAVQLILFLVGLDVYLAFAWGGMAAVSQHAGLQLLLRFFGFGQAGAILGLLAIASQVRTAARTEGTRRRWPDWLLGIAVVAAFAAITFAVPFVISGKF